VFSKSGTSVRFRCVCLAIYPFNDWNSRGVNGRCNVCIVINNTLAILYIHRTMISAPVGLYQSQW
jgi:hypothetical protein